MNIKREKILNELFNGFFTLAKEDYVCVYDIKNNLMKWSENAIEIFGLSGEYVDHNQFEMLQLIHPNDYQKCLKTLKKILSGKSSSLDLSIRMRIRDGSYIVCSSRGMLIRNEKGEPDFLGGYIKNQGLYMHTDFVTGIRNQYGFFKDLANIIEKKEKGEILLIGIDKFSQINDIHGYSYGNHVLQHFGLLIKELLGDIGTVYRMDGTKFAVITTIDHPNLMVKYQTLKQRLYGDFFVEGLRNNLTINGGLIVLDGLQVNDQTIYACLNYAYRESKNRRHGELVTFKNTDNGEQWKALEKLNAIRDAVIDNCKGFYLCYQPIVDVYTEKLTAVEALLRWQGEPYGEVPPFHFLPVLEQDAIFPILGNWILKQAMFDGVKLLQRYPHCILHINLSYVQLDMDDFESNVMRIIQETGFSRTNLCLEITEGCRLLDMKKLLHVVQSLHEQGVRFAIDDFGTGYASIDILKKLPADVVKIDREFVKDIESNVQDKNTLQHISALAASYGSNVCAEGIETSQMRDIMKKYPINTIQGFLYSKPLRFEEFMNKNFA